MIPHLQRLNVLLAELKRRQVFRAAAVYAMVAWVVIEVTATLLPIFLLPPWTVRAVAVLVVAGFPVVLSLAWAFDLTTKGVQRTGDPEGVAPLERQFVESFRFRATLVILVVVLTAGAGLVSWQLWLRPEAIGAPDDSEVAIGPRLDPSRLAVLYFDDFSQGGELSYLANGITEALIHELSQVEALSVTSRNGVKPYRNLSFPVDSLARLLDVGSLVEGSVEGSGERIAVTIQLIDGSSGVHQFSERIVGEGSDVLALRDSIVQQAADLIGQALGKELQIQRAREGSTNPDAWELYQRARGLTDDADTLRWARGDTLAARRTLERADSLYALAAQEDSRWPAPVIARGWNARTRAGLLSSFQSTRDEGLLEVALGMADKALSEDPGNTEALELRGALRVDLFRLGTLEGSDRLAQVAEEDLRAAIADPSRVFAHVALADLLRQQGRFQEASLEAQDALDADPFLINAEREVLFILSQIWLDLGDIQRANRWTDEGRRRFPAEPSFTAAKLVILAGWGGLLGAVDTAHALLAELEEELGDPEWPYGRLQVAAVLAQHGLADSAQALVDEVRGSGATDPWIKYFEANVALNLGQQDQALDLLGEFLTERPQRKGYIARDWWWEPLRDRPRFREMVATSGTAPG